MNSYIRHSRFFIVWAVVFFSLIHAHAAEKTEKIRYVEANIPNVSDVLFKKEILRADDPAAVDEYIRIHHCGLYEQYGQDDFSWMRIREAQARELELRHHEFPEGLEVSSAIRMDQYDLAKNELKIHPDSQIKNTAYITVMKESGGSFSACTRDNANPFVPRVHPLELVVKLDEPFDLMALPMSRATADQFIAVMNKRQELVEHVKRAATLVLRIRIIGVDPLASVADPMRRTVLGALASVRVYESPERKTLLFKKDFEIRPDEKDKL